MLTTKPKLGAKLDSFKVIGSGGVEEWFNSHRYTVVAHHHERDIIFIEAEFGSRSIEKLALPTEQYRIYGGNPLIKALADSIWNATASHTAPAQKIAVHLFEVGYRKVIPHNREFSKGETARNPADLSDRTYTAGIDIPGWCHAIECHAGTKEGAEKLRDEVLARLSL